MNSNSPNRRERNIYDSKICYPQELDYRYHHDKVVLAKNHYYFDPTIFLQDRQKDYGEPRTRESHSSVPNGGLSSKTKFKKLMLQKTAKVNKALFFQLNQC